MALSDAILYLLYLVLVAAIGVTIWAFIHQQRQAAAQTAQYHGLPWRRVRAIVWGSVAVVVAVVALLCRGDIASIMLVSLAVVLVGICLTMLWATIRRR